MRHPYLEDPGLERCRDPVLVGAVGKADTPGEGSVAEFAAVLPVVSLLGALFALGADLELTVLDGDLQILVRVDAREFGAQHEGPVVLGELLELERGVHAREPTE